MARIKKLPTGKPIDVDLDDLIPLGLARRRVSRFGSIRYSKRLYHVGDCHGQSVEVERIIDARGRPRLRIWKGTRIVTELHLFAPKLRKPGRPKKIRLEEVDWRPPWPEVFLEAA